MLPVAQAMQRLQKLTMSSECLELGIGDQMRRGDLQTGSYVTELVLCDHNTALREHCLAVLGGHYIYPLLTDVREPEIVPLMGIVLNVQAEFLAFVPLPGLMGL